MSNLKRDTLTQTMVTLRRAFLAPASRLLRPASRLLRPASRLLRPASRLLRPAFWLLTPGFCLLLTASGLLLPNPDWTLQHSGVTARMRGVSAVSDRVAWASGSGSTVLRTTDGGTTWQKLTVTSDQLDFRDIDAIDERTAYALSIGTGPVSRRRYR